MRSQRIASSFTRAMLTPRNTFSRAWTSRLSGLHMNLLRDDVVKRSGFRAQAGVTPPDAWCIFYECSCGWDLLARDRRLGEVFSRDVPRSRRSGVGLRGSYRDSSALSTTSAPGRRCRATAFVPATTMEDRLSMLIQVSAGRSRPPLLLLKPRGLFCACSLPASSRGRRLSAGTSTYDSPALSAATLWRSLSTPTTDSPASARPPQGVTPARAYARCPVTAIRASGLCNRGLVSDRREMVTNRVKISVIDHATKSYRQIMICFRRETLHPEQRVRGRRNAMANSGARRQDRLEGMSSGDDRASGGRLSKLAPPARVSVVTATPGISAPVHTSNA